MKLLFSSSYVDIESTNPVFSDLMNKYEQAQKERKAKNTSFLTPSKKYIMVEEFKDELKSFKNILNEIKKTRIIKRTRNKRNKKRDKKKVKYAR